MSGNEETRPDGTQEYAKNESGREEDYGYNFFPERDSNAKKTKTFGSMFTNSLRAGDKFNCEANVNTCMKQSLLVKLLVNALHFHGCPINVQRHIACEPCLGNLSGGYDVNRNQVVVCQNNSNTVAKCSGVLAHELIHMFDYCRTKANFIDNVEHLACSEIRAAALIHCSYLSSLQGGSLPIYVKKRHEECVKRKALISVTVARNIETEEAKKVIDKVFDKCYNDLEPFGRIPRRKSTDAEKMYYDGCQFGYCEAKTFSKQ